jgi:hypothetical protein
MRKRELPYIQAHTVILKHLYTPVHLHIYHTIQEKKPVFCSGSQSRNKGKWVRQLLRGANKM